MAKNKKYNFFTILEFATEMIGWLQIFLALLLIGAALGFGAYALIGNTTGVICGIVITLIGLLSAIYTANKKWKTTGTIKFIARISETPELDEAKPEE